MFLCAFDFFLLIVSLECLQVESRDVDLRLANRETVIKNFPQSSQKTWKQKIVWVVVVNVPLIVYSLFGNKFKFSKLI